MLFLIFLIGCSVPEKVTQDEEIYENNVESEPEAVPEEPTDLIPETGDIPTEPVAEMVTFSWEKDDGSRVVDGSVPFIHKLSGGESRLYYCKDNGILSALSSDGLTFTKEQGVRISPGKGFELQVCDPTIIDLPDEKIRKIRLAITERVIIIINTEERETKVLLEKLKNPLLTILLMFTHIVIVHYSLNIEHFNSFYRIFIYIPCFMLHVK